MSEWISVDVEIPNVDEEVVVVTEWGLVTTDSYFNRGYSEGFDNYEGYVTHWMPLPSPPEGEVK